MVIGIALVIVFFSVIGCIEIKKPVVVLRDYSSCTPWDAFALIKKEIGDTPLVLHGGTGIPADQIQKSISLGVSKINVNTECQLAFADATRKYIEAGKDKEKKGFDPRKLLAPGAEAIKEKVKEKILLFGSNNKV